MATHPMDPHDERTDETPVQQERRMSLFRRTRSQLPPDWTPTTHPAEPTARSAPVVVRGGVSIMSVLTGVMTALGMLLLGAAITAGIAAATDVSSRDLTAGADRTSPWTAIAFCAAVLVAFMWGGYAAGRMSRGMGLLNGLLVSVSTLAVGAAVVAIVDALGARASISTPSFGTVGIPLDGTALTTTGTVTAIVALVLMVAGSMIGGVRGAHWHRRLEDPSIARPSRHVRAA